jgi:hypothetical protein
MERVHTKEMAEALLRELPSVLGAFVREDVNGHPREIHLLISPGPSVKLLAQDVRELLEEKLGVAIDYRVISIAQLAEDVVDFGADDLLEEITGGAPAEPRLGFVSVVSEVRSQRVLVRTQLRAGETVHTGEAEELDLANGRVRAGAIATIRAVTSTLPELRLELAAISITRAFDRDYVLVYVMAGAASFGRNFVGLSGAQPVEHDVETAAALAVLKATNRIVAKLLK